jgi:hypothetical protein
VSPAALRIDRQAVRQDVIGFVGINPLVATMPREYEMIGLNEAELGGLLVQSAENGLAGCI